MARQRTLSQKHILQEKTEKGPRRIIRHLRIRKKVKGTSALPRLSVYRSLRHIYAQLIDDAAGKVLTGCSTLTPEIREAVKGKKKAEAAVKVGEFIAQLAAKKKITGVAFDRSGYRYHGRVKALADAARKGGLKF